MDSMRAGSVAFARTFDAGALRARETGRNACPTEERPDRADVAAVVAGAVDGRFQDEGAIRSLQARVVQDAREGLLSDVAAANVLVAVAARGEGRLGIV